MASDVAAITKNTEDISGDGLVYISIILKNIADVEDPSVEVIYIVSFTLEK